MSATSGGSSTVVRFSDSEISKLLNLPIAEITESNQDQVSAPNANDTRKSSSQCDNQNFLPKVRDEGGILLEYTQWARKLKKSSLKKS